MPLHLLWWSSLHVGLVVLVQAYLAFVQLHGDLVVVLIPRISWLSTRSSICCGGPRSMISHTVGVVLIWPVFLDALGLAPYGTLRSCSISSYWSFICCYGPRSMNSPSWSPWSLYCCCLNLACISWCSRPRFICGNGGRCGTFVMQS